MEQFLVKNNSKINKNNVLTIKYGKQITQNMFDYRTNASDVKKFIKGIKEQYNCNQPQLKKCIEYKYQNSIVNIGKSNSEFVYKLIDNLDTKICRMTLLNKIDKKAISNINVYDDIVMYDKISFNINDLFIIDICSIDSTNYYKISIVITKPNNINELNH